MRYYKLLQRNAVDGLLYSARIGGKHKLHYPEGQFIQCPYTSAGYQAPMMVFTTVSAAKSHMTFTDEMWAVEGTPSYLPADRVSGTISDIEEFWNGLASGKHIARSMSPPTGTAFLHSMTLVRRLNQNEIDAGTEVTIDAVPVETAGEKISNFLEENSLSFADLVQYVTEDGFGSFLSEVQHTDLMEALSDHLSFDDVANCYSDYDVDDFVEGRANKPDVDSILRGIRDVLEDNGC